MTKFLAICFIILGLTLQVCDKGCLKCTAKDDCLFCDTTSNYYLSNGNCALSSITNCLILNSNGDCGQCKANFSLDSSTKKCIAVATVNQVANCSLYGNNQVCIKCAKNFYISVGKCTAVVKLVNNCETYSDDGKCTGCSTGFIFNAARDSCLASPGTAGCLAYGLIDCKTCASGFIQNFNFYFVNYQSSSVLYADLLNFFRTGVTSDWTTLNRCQKIQDANCLTASAFNVCSICKPKYFLAANKSCRAFPYEIIEFCLTYSSLTTCNGCQSGYFLENSKKCTLVTGDKLIADCVNYNGKASSAQCLLCSTSRFLSGNTCSSVRVDSVNIANCKSNAVSADACGICNDGFILTTDGKKCLAAISNCTEYNPSSSASTSLVCKTCAQSYFLNTVDSVTTCVAGSLEGCLTYSSSTICSSCNTVEYYLKDSKCSKHIKVDLCSKYKDSSFNECATCIAGFFPFKYSSYCLSVTLIANCSAYSDETTCVACFSGYYVLNNKCVSILQTFPNCLSAATNSINCTECVNRYALKSLATDKTCGLNHNYILDFCYFAGSNISFKANNVVDTDSCLICKDSTFPFDLSYLTVCVSDTLLATRGVDSPVVGCRKYSSDASPVCQQCPLYVGITAANVRSCQDTCTSTTSTHLLDDLTGSVNTCTLMTGGFTSNALAKCSIAVKAKIGAAFALTCIKVTGTERPLVSVADATVVADNPTIWKDLSDTSITRPDEAFLYNGIEITPSSGETTKHKALDINCELYWKRGDNKLYCARCKFGYTVRFKNLTGVPTWTDADDYESSCEGVDFCDTSIKYSGFKSTLNRFLSCHVCTGTKFVTVVLGVLDVSDALTYNISSFIHDKPVVACRDTTAGVSTFDVPLLVANCLVYGWNFRNVTPDTPITPTIAKGCLACKPGFALTYAAGTDAFGSACTAITDCDNTKKAMANRCSVCTQVDGLGAAAPKALADYTGLVCRLVKSANCLFSGAGPDGNNKYECRVCNPGHWLNHDKICEKLTLPQCADASGSTNLYAFPASPSVIGSWAAGRIEEYYALKFLAKANSITGCDTCYSGFTGFRTVSGEKQCLASPYVTTNVFLAATAKYVPDCLRYNNNLNIASDPAATCDVCRPGKIRTDDSKKCVAAISKCLFAQNDPNSTKCQTCESTHVSILGVCTAKTIALCATYNESVLVTDLLCATCNSGYVLSTNKKSCYKGKVTGCKSYDLDLPYVCNTCFDGFSKVNTVNNRTYCFKINDLSNCKTLEGGIGGLQDGLFKCNACNVSTSAAYIVKPYANSDVAKVQSLCLSLNLVENCLTYGNQSSTVTVNSYLCTACLPNFWLDEDNNVCIARLNLPAGCTEYEKNKDRCKTCSDSTFLNENSTDCLSFPNGILRCATYSNDTICTSCQPPAYLSSNACLLSNVIPKCASYSANNTCTACDPSYYLTNSTFCELAKAANCFTYSAIDKCEKCNPDDFNKGLKTDVNGVISCLDKNVPNCDISTNEFPFKCTKCKRGFYIGTDGNCAAATVIKNCIVYDSVSTCTLCEPLTILAVDRKTCEDINFAPFNDINCLDSQLLSTPICSRCTPGSIFVNNTCTACSNNTYSEGCFSCDPSNQANCLACRPGFSQKANGKCSAVVSQTINNNNTTSSAFMIKLIGLVAILVTLTF